MKKLLGLLALVTTGMSGIASAQDSSRYPLLTIEQNRASIVKRIVDDWSSGLATLPNNRGRSADELALQLTGLRADRLLAASLAGRFDTVERVIAESQAETGRVENGAKAPSKVIGDVAADFTYTPLTPCRIVDTRNAGGALQPNDVRTFDGYNPGSFAFQGGAASSCGIPSDVNALALNVAAVQPAAPGFINLWPANASQPNASVINFAGEFALATGTIIGVDGVQQNRFRASSPAAVHLVVDVVGYFRRPPNFGGNHFVSGQYATDGGGYGNTVAGQYAATGGGYQNAANGQASAVAGGMFNQAGGTVSFIGGGYSNAAFGSSYATIGGGFENNAGGYASAIAGGYTNAANGTRAFVGGGIGNQASGDSSAVAGGAGNSATNFYATVGGGLQNIAIGNYSTVPGGYANAANGNYSFAAGTLASAYNPVGFASYDGVFIWSDNVSNTLRFYANSANEFAARATGGVRFVTAIDGSGTPTAGVSLASGAGTWANLSDRAAKRNLMPVDSNAILDRVTQMPVYSWQYATEASGARHVGPTAQDFHAAFGLGDSDKTITTIDADGIALASIQALRRMIDDRDQRIASLERALDAIKARLGIE